MFTHPDLLLSWHEKVGNVSSQSFYVMFCKNPPFVYNEQVRNILLNSNINMLDRLLEQERILVIEVLQGLTTYRDKASVFITRLQSGMYDASFLSQLSSSLKVALTKVKHNKETKQIKKAIKTIKDIHSKELREKEIGDAENLLDHI